MSEELTVTGEVKGYSFKDVNGLGNLSKFAYFNDYTHFLTHMDVVKIYFSDWDKKYFSDKEIVDFISSWLLVEKEVKFFKDYPHYYIKKISECSTDFHLVSSRQDCWLPTYSYNKDYRNYINQSDHIYKSYLSFKLSNLDNLILGNYKNNKFQKLSNEEEDSIAKKIAIRCALEDLRFNAGKDSNVIKDSLLLSNDFFTHMINTDMVDALDLNILITTGTSSFARLLSIKTERNNLSLSDSLLSEYGIKSVDPFECLQLSIIEKHNFRMIDNNSAHLLKLAFNNEAHPEILEINIIPLVDIYRDFYRLYSQYLKKASKFIKQNAFAHASL